MSMFCYQCQEANRGVGCEVRGVCGKGPETAALQDVLLHLARSCSVAAVSLRRAGAEAPSIAAWLRDALFATITNANFDDSALERKIHAGDALFQQLLSAGCAAGVAISPWSRDAERGRDELLQLAPRVGVKRTEHEDIRSLRELLTYGLKGLAAYVAHAAELGCRDPALENFLEEALAATADDSLGADELTSLVLAAGEQGVKGMALLDGANTGRFGHPELTTVSLGVGTRPGILVSGHDLGDLEQLLEQSKDAGIDIYTHSEMLPAHYYPAFKKYAHLRGNYGNAWWQQTREFESFRGPILFTTNCIVPPPPSASYRTRLFTTGSAGFPGASHVEKGPDGNKDFSALIELAKRCESPLELEQGEIVGGFAHQQVSALAGQVVEAVKSGAVKKFVVMAGCDGRQKSRSYYSDFAQELPEDSIILTAGCAKYRYNKLSLGSIGGIPRVLDAGQCNDSYSLAVTALALKDAFGLKDINDLPVEYNIAWYEQKAVIVLLALLHLGVKKIQLGPTLPAFLSPGVARVLVETFGLRAAPVEALEAAE